MGTWSLLMLDGIRLSKEQTAEVALGIDSEGNKHVLVSSESLEVSRDLMSRIVKRVFPCSHRVYVVLDSSDALRGAIKELSSDAVIQRCLVHKARNIKGKSSKSHWGEMAELFKRRCNLQDLATAEEVLDVLKTFSEPIYTEAFKSLQEAGEDLLALHRLVLQNPLHRSLLSTNTIENSFLNTRRKDWSRHTLSCRN